MSLILEFQHLTFFMKIRQDSSWKSVRRGSKKEKNVEMSSLVIIHSGLIRGPWTDHLSQPSLCKPSCYLELIVVIFSLLELKKITLLSGEEEKLLLIANPHRLDEFVVGRFSDGTEGWNDVSEEDKIAMNYYEKHQVHFIKIDKKSVKISQ